MMAGKTLLLISALFTGVCPQRTQQIYVMAGEMVALLCPHYTERNDGDAKLIWSSYTSQEMNLSSDVSPAEQRQMGVLLHERSLVILSASVNHQGNYSCSLGNSSRSWFSLTVYSTQTREFEERTMYSATCYTQEACRLNCPTVNIPAENTPNVTNDGILWHKKGESLPKDGYFPSVEENDHGVYTCTRAYLYQGQRYHRTFTMVLDVQLNKISQQPVILSPRENDVFQVALDSTLVIDCKAVIYSDFDEVFWLSENSFVETNNSLPVFYNYTRENIDEGIKMTASLVFKKVSEEDLSKQYTCKLESVSEPSNFVTISLAKRASLFGLSLACCIVGTVVMIVCVTAVCVKLKMDIALFLRDTLGCNQSYSDGKSYDAFLMSYKSDKGPGLNEDDRRWLKSVLEERFGYSLCLYDRDVLPGKAVAEAVLDCIEQSRAVVLVPTSPDPAGLGSGLLSAIHAALVERQTRLVFIRTESAEASRSGSLPEALQLLGEAGDCVTWKGISSMTPSSSFWKQLRYYLPAPQHAPKIQLLPQTV